MQMTDIFIPSYHRPENIKTCRYFEKIGYDMSRLTVFIDDETDDIEEYRKACEAFGCNLHVFSMRESRERYDYVHRPSKSRRSAGQARYMFHDYAAEHGIDFYCVIDDDTSSYVIRKIGYPSYMRPATLDDVLWMMRHTEDFMRRRHIGCFGWSQCGDYYGANIHYYRKKVMNTTFYLHPYIYRGERGYGDDDTSQFVGIMNNGLFTGSYATGCVLQQAQSATQQGGLTDLYNETKLLSKGILCPIQYPSAIHCERQMMNGNRLHHRVNYRYLMPKVLKGDGTVDNIPWDTYPEDYPFTNEPKHRRPISTGAEQMERATQGYLPPNDEKSPTSENRED